MTKETNTTSLVENQKLSENTQNSFSELVKVLVNHRKQNLLSIVSKYDQEHLTREELINLLVAEITRV
jgi:predicted CopG family antitoxin